MNTGKVIMVGANATCRSDLDVSKAVEALSRVLAGLAMEGLTVSISAVEVDEDGDPCAGCGDAT